MNCYLEVTIDSQPECTFVTSEVEMQRNVHVRKNFVLVVES
jgi:hypothetical protein